MYSRVTKLEDKRGGVGRESGLFPRIVLIGVPLPLLSDGQLIEAMLADAPGVAPDDVRDVRGSLYLSLVRNDRHQLRSFDPTRGNRFSSWIGLLAINCAYDHLRALKRESHKGALAEAADVVSTLPSPFDVAVENERAVIASDLLAGLSERDRDSATLYFGEELNPEQIAARMNISVKTVYSKKHKIQTRLARLEEVLACGTDAISAGPERRGYRSLPDAPDCDESGPSQTLF